MKTRTPRLSAPRLCPGGTVVCVASGPSLTREDVEACRARVDATIVVNDSYRIAPLATALYAADLRWWLWQTQFHQAAITAFAGLKYTIGPVQAKVTRDLGVTHLENTGVEGLETKATGLRTGRHSGYQAINLAVHFGAARILLLGYDLQPGPKGEEHWHGEHPNKSRSPHKLYREKYQSMVEPLRTLGVEVLNCSRRTALTAFPCVALQTVLEGRAA